MGKQRGVDRASAGSGPSVEEGSSFPAQPTSKATQHQVLAQEHRREVIDGVFGAKSRNSQEGAAKHERFLLSTLRAERGKGL